jgi:hypothetical protein
VNRNVTVPVGRGIRPSAYHSPDATHFDALGTFRAFKLRTRF